MEELFTLWKARQDCIARTEADRVVADAVIRWSGKERDRQPFYMLQGVAGGKAGSQAYRGRLHERFVEVCN